MATNEEKSKKLKEIQDRLAEIQSKSNTAPKQTKPDSIASKTAPPATTTTDTNTSKVEPTKKKAKPSTESDMSEPDVKTPAKAKKETIETKAIEKKVEDKKSVEPPKKQEKSEPLKKSSSNQSTWSENKSKDSTNKPISKKKSSNNKLSKIYTIISLVVTAAVVTYFLFTYFSDSGGVEEAVTKKIPEEIMEDENSAENAKLEIVEPEISEQDEIGVVEDNEVMQSRAKPTRIKENNEIKQSEPVTSKNTGAVPNGFIISYASNSSVAMAEKNVQRLTSKGYDADYYFMPDHKPGSPQLYKVYVGPFSDESAALPTFKKIVVLNDKAFILKMD